MVNLPKSSTFLGNFCKGIKIYHSSSEIILGNFYRNLPIFSGHSASNTIDLRFKSSHRQILFLLSTKIKKTLFANFFNFPFSIPTCNVIGLYLLNNNNDHI